MEIKATLDKPYTEEQRADFIITQNHQKGYEIRETFEALQAWGYTEEDKVKLREKDFKSRFFNVDGYGYYRIQPKGYQSAVESMNVLFNAAIAMNGIQAGLIIFYEEPDFTKPEQCTEEWLVAHQIVMPAMTKEEFIRLWAAFTQAWNSQEHETTVDEVENDTI